MKCSKTIARVTFILLVIQHTFSQEHPKAVLLDEFGKICSEDFRARSDSFYIHLQNDPNAKVYIVLTGDRKFEGRNLYWVVAMTGWFRYPTIDYSRIILVRGENQDDMSVQFWLVPAGATPPKPEKEFKQPGITETTLFDRNWADFYRDEESGRSKIYSNGFFDLGCEFPPNAGQFAKKLLSDKGLTGYLLVYTAPNRGAKRGNMVGRFAVNDLVKTYKVPRSRLKMIYGGKRGKPEIELWFVPKGQKPPVPAPGAKNK